MFLRDDEVVLSASDLSSASQCEFGFLRGIDVKLGRVEGPAGEPDPIVERAAKLGDQHEQRVLQGYRDRFGTAGVVEVDRVSVTDTAAVAAAVAKTRQAFAAGADVVYQATFSEPGFIGFADFIVRRPDGSYRVQDTKLARSAKVTALLQLAAYAQRLAAWEVPVDDTVELLLGDGRASAHRLADIEPVYRLRRARLEQIVAQRCAADGPLAWGDPRHPACGRCPACAAEVEAHRDLLLVANLRRTQRDRLRAAGLTTIEELAGSTGPVAGMAAATLAGLRAQARLQTAPSAVDAGGHPVPPFELRDPAALAAIPAADPGDIFFDFEGDPLHNEGDEARWGLDYLFGLVTADGTFHRWWAHSFAAEREALLGFLDFVQQRRAAHPGLHVYHYAAYERTHLLSIAARHGVGEEVVDQLLREHVLVDLYPIVRKALLVGSPSYSLKKLEPLYMGDDLRESEVTTAGDSITEYAAARAAEAAGDEELHQRKLAEIEDYNAYDCRSTRHLRDWLTGLAAAAGISPNTPAERAVEPEAIAPSPLAGELWALAGDPLSARTPEQQAYGLVAAAIDYHRREHKQFWWGHFARLTGPVEDWADTRDVLVADRVEVLEDWHREGRQRDDRRTLQLSGSWAPGSSPRPGGDAYLLYDDPQLRPTANADQSARSAVLVKITSVAGDGTVTVEEKLAEDGERHGQEPVALTPGPPPGPGSQPGAIAEWATAAARAWPADPIGDLLRRLQPRTRSGSLARLGQAGEDLPAAITATLLDLDNSYLAVQGPPGTGKTHTAAQVIRELVERHHWKIGVVAQSHKVVENVLNAVTAAGLDPDLVGKAIQQGAAPEPASFTWLKTNNALPGFMAERADSGFVVGGTAWAFSNAATIPRGALNLLVVDEAGQFALAPTIAAAASAVNLLLLGDPQQLPQVSQGTHPEPVDTSCLGWISAGHDVLPSANGYFLDRSWRMHPEVTRPVSALSYAGQLRSHPSTLERSLAGVAPGLHVRGIRHTGNRTSSVAESNEILAIAQSVLGRAWVPQAGASPRPIGEADLIVVAPYNAQVQQIRQTLDRAGLGGIPVGTVDKFQGQEAVVALISLAASDASEVPRGLEFLLMPNRLNVAISRAKWAAWLVHSPGLLDHLPATPSGVAQLSAFARLVQARSAADEREPSAPALS